MQATPTPQSITWLRLPDLIRNRRRARTSLYRDVADGLLTPPVRIGANCSAWPDFEVDAIDRARLAGADDVAVRKLVADLIAARKVAA